jgi:hypothetical protein
MDSSHLFEHPHQVVQELASFLGLQYGEDQQEKSVNQNSSRSDITVSPEARSIAKKHLKNVPSKVDDVVTEEMVVGEDLALQ